MRSAILVASLALFSACSDDTSGSGGNGGASTNAGAGSSVGGNGASSAGGANAGGGTVGCDPACVAPQTCSIAGQCIDPGTCLADGDCPTPGTVCDVATMTCVPGGGCEDLMATIEPIPPNLLLVLDRSCSMTEIVSANVTKWDAAVAAINTLTTTYAGKIRFGLTVFPDLVTPNCAQDAIAIPIAPNTEPAIQTLLTNSLANADPYFPDGPCVTNIDTAMQQAAAAPELTDATRDNYVALITDGKQAGCNAAGGDNGTLMIIQNLFAAGVPTFVVGFGSGVDPAQMDIFAQAGGVPNTTPLYYDAADQMSLQTVLDVIATKAISCTFNLDTVPPDASQIYVFFDNQPVPEDATMMDGWSYDMAANQIVFHGATCDQLKSGLVGDVQVILGCAGPQ